MTGDANDDRGVDGPDGSGSDDGSESPDGPVTGDWPVDLRGVTESVVTTRGPNGRWNVAALGLHARDPHTGDDATSYEATAHEATAPDATSPDATALVTARTYGRTRTWRNFRERGEGYVQFTRDPVDFVEAALAVRESEEPLLDDVDAWSRVEAIEQDSADEDGTHVTTWALEPVESAVERETVPTTNRGYNAVVEATVAASRLDVAAYDEAALLDRLAYFADVTEACGGPREREAFARIESLVDAEW